MTQRYESRTNVASNGKCPPFVKGDKEGAALNKAPFLWDAVFQKQLMMSICIDAYATASDAGTTTRKGLSRITFHNYMGAEGRDCHRSRLFSGNGIYEHVTRFIQEDEMSAMLGGDGSSQKLV